LVAQRESTTLKYIHQDSLSSTSVMSTSTGTLDSSITFFPFGGTRTGSVSSDKKFTGQRLDVTGLYYYNARYYDPLIGRFISADTIVQSPANPQTLNRYSYVMNNPLKYIDPSGHDENEDNLNTLIGKFRFDPVNDAEIIDALRSILPNLDAETLGILMNQVDVIQFADISGGSTSCYKIIYTINGTTPFFTISLQKGHNIETLIYLLTHELRHTYQYTQFYKTGNSGWTNPTFMEWDARVWAGKVTDKMGITKSIDTGYRNGIYDCRKYSLQLGVRSTFDYKKMRAFFWSLNVFNIGQQHQFGSWENWLYGWYYVQNLNGYMSLFIPGY